MKYGLYEDPQTHRFALLPLPDRFGDDDVVPVPDAVSWFDSREEAMATLPDLLNREEPGTRPGDPVSGAGRPH